MTLFRKSQNRSLDPKGRLMLPVEYREALLACASADSSVESSTTGMELAPSPNARADAAAFVLTGFYGRLVAYTLKDWEKNVEQLSRIRNPSMKLSRFMSKVMGLAEEVALDSQGRIRIPQPLMREAGLVKDAVLVGMGRKFEIWDQARFEALELEDVADELAAGGIDISL